MFTTLQLRSSLYCNCTCTYVTMLYIIMGSNGLKIRIERKHVTLTVMDKVRVTEQLENSVISFVSFRVVFFSLIRIIA
jgi:hypothetical protein